MLVSQKFAQPVNKKGGDNINKREKEVLQLQLEAEEDILAELEKQYKRALKDIDEKIKFLQTDELTQSRIYQIQYQQALKGQIEGIIEKLHSDGYTSIQQFLNNAYTDAFIGTAYDLAGQGIPLIMPIDQNAAVKAIITDSKIKEDLYTALGADAKALKKSIRQEITRGIASGMHYQDIARNISEASKAPLSRAKTIARTESHRIQQASTYDAQKAAKKRGADVLKQWDSTLDGRTRSTHRHLDGQIKEVEKPFEMDGKKAMFPGEFNDPAEDVNCRCVSLTRARWGLDEDELKVLQQRAEYFGLDKTDSFEDYKKKYLKAVSESEKQYGIAYGKDAVDVDMEYINSKEYKDKFSQITDNPKANESIRSVSKTMLEHCNGTEHEDMYLLGMDGKIISKVTDSVSTLGINYSDEFKKALADVTENGTPVIAIHNHPHGTPPSSDDFRKAYENKYSVGVIVGHNGQIYVYSNNGVKLTLEQADQIAEDIETLYKMGWDIDRASKLVYDDYGLNYTIIERAD